MSLFSKRNLDKSSNKYGITEDDMKGYLKDFPVGVVVRMMEEQEAQGNKPDVKVFQDMLNADVVEGGYNWGKTKDGTDFWFDVIFRRKFNLFFEKYPEYKM